jgi:hypothetical protein
MVRRQVKDLPRIGVAKPLRLIEPTNPKGSSKKNLGEIKP